MRYRAIRQFNYSWRNDIPFCTVKEGSLWNGTWIGNKIYLMGEKYHIWFEREFFNQCILGRDMELVDEIDTTL